MYEQSLERKFESVYRTHDAVSVIKWTIANERTNTKVYIICLHAFNLSQASSVNLIAASMS